MLESVIDTRDINRDINSVKNAQKDPQQAILDLAQRLDFLDIQLLRKFYITGKDFPFDTQPYCFPILYKEMKESRQLMIGIEAFRKRLDNLTKLGLLEKIHNSNPTNYFPVNGKEQFAREIIMKFFLINGLAKFL